MPYRIYLDYNVIEDSLKERICLPNRNYNIFCSVAHGEEYYNACCQATKEFMEDAFKDRETLIKVCKYNIILNPDKNRVRAKAEKFDECIDRIKKYDTRDIVKRNGGCIFNNNKEIVSELRKTNVETVNNSNLGYDEIWQKSEVIERLELFKEYYKKCKVKVPKKKVAMYRNILRNKGLSKKVSVR